MEKKHILTLKIKILTILYPNKLQQNKKCSNKCLK